MQWAAFALDCLLLAPALGGWGMGWERQKRRGILSSQVPTDQLGSEWDDGGRAFWRKLGRARGGGSDDGSRFGEGRVRVERSDMGGLGWVNVCRCLDGCQLDAGTAAPFPRRDELYMARDECGRGDPTADAPASG